MESRINHIIARVLSGEASSEDILLLSEWLSEGAKNRDEFRQLKSYWEAEVVFNNSVAPSLSLEKLQKTIRTQRRNTKKHPWLHTFSIAAAIVLLVAIPSLVLMKTGGYIASENYTYLTDKHKSTFRMEDGTVITLNKNSRLSYNDSYGKKKRSVKLEGEAYFEVAKDADKPFRVEMEDASITVLGTHFNVKADSGSDEITATLIEGSIRFEGAQQNIVMTPDQQLTFSRSTCNIDLHHVNTDPFTSWKDGLLKYKSIPFIELISDLRKIYQVEINIENPELTEPHVTVTGAFPKDQNIEQILKTISRSLPIRWYNSDGVYYIR